VKKTWVEREAYSTAFCELLCTYYDKHVPVGCEHAVIVSCLEVNQEHSWNIVFTLTAFDKLQYRRKTQPLETRLMMVLE